MSASSHSWANAVRMLAAIIAVVSAGAMWFVHHSGLNLLFFPVTTVAVASFLYVLSGMTLSLDRSPGTDVPSVPDKVLTAVMFLLVALVVFVGRTSVGGLSSHFYLVLLMAVAAIGYQALRDPDTLVLLAIVLLLTSIVATMQDLVIVFGKDAQWHIAYAEYLYRNGRLIPRHITYYWGYPAAQVGSVVTAFVFGTDVRTAYVTFLGLSMVVATPVAFLLTRFVFAERPSDDRLAASGALLATLMMGLSAYYLQFAAWPIAQALSIALVPFVLYLVVRGSDVRFITLAMVLLLTGELSHNLTPLLLALVLFTYLVFRFGIETARTRRLALGDLTGRRYIPVIMLVMGFFHYIYIGYLLNFKRPFYIFLPSGSVTQAVESAGTSPGTTVLSLDSMLSNAKILFVSGDLMLWVLLLTIAGYMLLESLTNRGQFSDAGVAWTLTAITVSGVVLGALYVGQATAHVNRGLFIVGIIAAPVGGYVLRRLYRDLGRGGHGVVVALLLMFALFSAAHPGVSVTERDDSLQTPTLTESEIVATEFAYDYGLRVYSDSFLAGSSAARDVGRLHPSGEPLGQHDDHIRSVPLHEINSTYFDWYRAAEYDAPFIYRDYVGYYRDVEQPLTYQKLYSSGSTSIIYPTHLNSRSRFDRNVSWDGNDRIT